MSALRALGLFAAAVAGGALGGVALNAIGAAL